MQEHINRGGVRYGNHIRNHMLTDPGPYVHREVTLGERISQGLLVLTTALATPLAIVLALMSLGV
jgi:hypothetical protein